MTQDIKLKSGQVLKVEEMPEGHRIEYLAKSLEKETKFYVVHAPHLTEENVGKIDNYYNSFGMYLGTPENMQKTKVTSVDRYRGALGTFVHYILNEQPGTLHFPTRFLSDEPSTDTYGEGRSRSVVELEELIKSDE